MIFGRREPQTPTHQPPAPPPAFDRRKVRALPSEPGRRGLLARLRIRKKLILLHTVFSLALAGILLLGLRPAVRGVVERAEMDEARVLLQSIAPRLDGAASQGSLDLPKDAEIHSGTASDLGLDASSVVAALAAPGRSVFVEDSALGPGAVLYVPASASRPERFTFMRVRIVEARQAVLRLYIFMIGALLAIYALVALALEVFVLPQNVYRPIRSILAADAAVQKGEKQSELVPEGDIPEDELGEIMRSRNDTVLRLRRQEAQLADALQRLEAVANDLKRKNHLLETAQRNLVDADRLASLGMMSAGIAHELNTPLAVLKGLVEKLNGDPAAGLPAAQAALMLRVVRRLETLGESLLDFARVRPPRSRPVLLAEVVGEAVTLARLERDAAGIEFEPAIPEGFVVQCDPDRMMQVLVNLLRNAADAIRTKAAPRSGRVRIGASASTRDHREWVSITVTDDGPGIDAAVLPHLFEPFVSTRLDSRGTGLGLAVAEGIVREHGGVLLARNRTDSPGAVFEIILPLDHVPGNGANVVESAQSSMHSP